MFTALGHVLWGIAPLYVTMLFVMLLKHNKILTTEGLPLLNALFFKLAAPALIFLALSSAQISIKSVIPIFAGAIVFALFFSASFLLRKVLSSSEKTQKMWSLGLTSFMIGPIVYPMVQPLLPVSVFAQLVLVDLTLLVLFLIFAPIIAQSGTSRNKEIVDLFTKNPILWAVYAGSIVSMLQLSVPSEIKSVFSLSANAFSFIGAVMLGLSITAPSLQQLRTIGIPVALKVLTGLFIVAVTIMLPLEYGLKQAIVFCAMAPFSIMSVLFSKEFDLDSSLVAQALIASSVLAVIVYPILLLFFG